MGDSRVEVSAGRRFAFGANWQSFVRLVDETRIEGARRSLTETLGIGNLSGRTFLDIGCGSGLFSLAAHQLGARVRSFDFDPDSVAAAGELRRQYAPHSDWSVEQGSILDEDYVAGLGYSDIVYSWGVLHHTGDLWRAVDTAVRLVAPGGLLFISIYNDQGSASRRWRRVKRLYNTSGPVTRGLLVAGSFAYLGRHWPVRAVSRGVRRLPAAEAPPVRARGMSRRHDLIDWVGGYPFEVASPEDVFRRVHPLGFELRHLKTCAGGLGCNEYVFEQAAPSWQRPLVIPASRQRPVPGAVPGSAGSQPGRE
jgi:2-polyprenyl-6-hydroxyphenyl methylase/3-demethylubiquinone-9 3-methyltransferase